MQRYIENRISIRSLARAGRALIALCLCGFAWKANAHHSYVGDYDTSRVVTLSGTITSVRYVNPHIFFTVSAASSGGGQTSWTVETESILMARRKGVSEEKLAAGRKVSVRGWPARNGMPELGLSAIRFGDGSWITLRRSPR